jgi:hypothetical protein
MSSDYFHFAREALASLVSTQMGFDVNSAELRVPSAPVCAASPGIAAASGVPELARSARRLRRSTATAVTLKL